MCAHNTSSYIHSSVKSFFFPSFYNMFLAYHKGNLCPSLSKVLFLLLYIFSMLLLKIFKRIFVSWSLMITGKKNWHVHFMLNSRTGYMVIYSFTDDILLLAWISCYQTSFTNLFLSVWPRHSTSGWAICLLTM